MAQLKEGSVIKKSTGDEIIATINDLDGTGGGVIVDLGTFNDQTELITHVAMNQLPTGQYTFIMNDYPYLMLLRDAGSYYRGVFQDSEGAYIFFNVSKTGEIVFLNEFNILHQIGDIHDFFMPRSGGVLENYSEQYGYLYGTSTTIDLSFANVFRHSLTGNTTYSITNALSGCAHSFTLIINIGATARTLTFPASVKWQGGEIPDLSTANKTYVLTFMTVDGGTTWLGMFGGEF